MRAAATCARSITEAIGRSLAGEGATVVGAEGVKAVSAWNQRSVHHAAESIPARQPCSQNDITVWLAPNGSTYEPNASN